MRIGKDTAHRRFGLMLCFLGCIVLANTVEALEKTKSSSLRSMKEVHAKKKEGPVVVEVLHDDYPSEAGWTLGDSAGELIANRGTRPVVVEVQHDDYPSKTGLTLGDRVLLPAECDPERGFLGFHGVLMAISIDNGTLDVEWEPAGFVSDNDVLPLLCDDPVYDVFLAAAPFNYTDANITELIELAQTSNGTTIVHVRTDDLFLNLENLEPGATFSVLVTASAEDILYSDNRDGLDIKVSTTAVVPNRNVTKFLGTFEADDDTLIEYDNATGLLYFVNNVPAEILDDIQVGFHLAVITSDDENYIFHVTNVIDVSAAAATLMVEEAALGDLVEELDFDSVMDSGRIVNAAEALSRRRRELKEFTLFDRVLTKEAELVFGDFTVRGLLEVRAYLRVKVEISVRKLKADARITLGGSIKTEASFKWAKAMTQANEFKTNVFRGPKIRIRFTVWLVPVWINLTPLIDLEGNVEVELKASAEITMSQMGAVEVVGYYEGAEFGGDATSSFSQELTTEVKGQASAKAEAAIVLTMRVLVYGVVGGDVGVKGGLKWEAVAEVIFNPVIALPPFHFTKFDIDAFAEAPVKILVTLPGFRGGRRINKDLGNLFELTYPLLRLPRAELEKVDVKKCNGANALELYARAVEQPYPYFIPNVLKDPHLWIDDFAPEGLGESATPAAPFYGINMETTQNNVVWSLPRADIATFRHFEIPTGDIYFKTTPFIPGIPLTLMFNESVTDLFGTQKFECCEKEECDILYPNDDFDCGIDCMCAASTQPPTSMPSTQSPTTSPTTPTPSTQPPTSMPTTPSPTTSPTTPSPSTQLPTSMPSTPSPSTQPPTTMPLTQPPTTMPLTQPPTTSPTTPSPTRMEGDPHIVTWRGHRFDYQGECDLVMIQSAKFASHLGLVLHVRTKIVHDYSYIASVALKIGDDIIELQSKGVYYLNGVADAEMPNKFAGFPMTYTESSKKRHIVEVDLGHRGKISFREFKDFISVIIEQGSSDNFGDSIGLMGSFDTGSMLARDGETVLDDPSAFGQEWQVLDTEPKIFQTVRAPQHPQVCNLPSPATEKRRRLGESAVSELDAEKACAHWGEDKGSCIYDVLATGDLEMAEVGAY